MVIIVTMEFYSHLFVVFLIVLVSKLAKVKLFLYLCAH